MCQVPHPKCRTVASVPAAAAAPPDNNDAKDDNNDDDDDNNEDVDSPCADRLVIDIVKIATDDCGCKCREHNVCCGKVVYVDIVVRLRREEILVPDDYLGKGNMRKQTAITVNWVTNGFEAAVWDFSRSCMFPMLPAMIVPSIR
jgi:hypothetical protein